ncbi:ricin-type beta-trefoil lectin domain protein [Streptomyces sp. c-19]|uniref:ricin-type beta-trefoil lectin domain protein n=1 Tax=Streptomyces sp. c-19 TaxID=2789275 RepID=UPI00397FF7F0
MRFKPGLFNSRSRSSTTRTTTLTTAVTSVAALAVLGGLAVPPALAAQNAAQSAAPNLAPMADSYDGYDAKAAQQLREDQCMATEALRMGGPNLHALAQSALVLPPDQLHAQLKRDMMDDKTPLHAAWNQDRALTDEWLEKVRKQGYAWSSATSGLESYPNAPKDPDEIFDRTGLLPWLYQGFSDPLNLFNPFYDSSPTADDKTKAAALAIGDPLYTSGGTAQEKEAWALWKKNSGKIEPNQFFVPRVFADDARIFLASGGFPRTASAPGSPEFRIAVEDLKARFGACGWHDPIDPNKVLGKQVAQAATEWQQEITGQAAQRQQILTAGKDAGKALQDGTYALSMLLGQSWLADYYTRWQDHWAPGGVGWIGDSPAAIEVPGAPGMCLDVQGAGKTNGTPVQIYTCNGSAAQQWTIEGGEEDLHLRNVNSFKCLDVAGNASANGTKVQITDCYSTKGQSWKGDVRAASPLKSLTTGKCLDLSAFTKSTDTRLWDCKGTSAQKFLVKPSGHKGTDSLSYPEKAQFDAAKKGLADAQAAAKKHLATVKAQLETAKKSAVSSDAAVQASYGIADAAGAPRGRGLLVGQQKAQVTKGAVAALTAMVKAGETAEAATRAAAGDSATIAQRALAQTAQVNAEFRKEAARTAELQAKAAADGAKLHRDNAKKDKETAEAKLAVALKAEGDAKAAAADAHAKRLAAEAEEAKAKAEKDTAAVKQNEAAQHKKTADAEAIKAEDARKAAEASEGTAVEKKNAAVKARDNAKDKRDDAWEAEQRADAARAKADAKEAYAQAHESDGYAKESRAAADAASAHADDAEAAAGRARGAADAATRAAAEADAAATRAEAAAKRSRAHADAAHAAKLKAEAAVRTATSAAADALAASDHAAAEARTAVALADEAERKAKEAKTHADAASKEAATARTAAGKAAGFAHVTAQAAAEAGAAAVQVAKPANDAIQLGSPYATTDSSAGLVVLTGQASKTIAEQQKAVADAHAKNAQAEAAAAKNLADTATGDAKQAYVHAANAAGHAATARGYAKEALGYAAGAAEAASKASASLARTLEYDRKAAEDAAAADKAAGRAEGYARAARDSADQAALDAEGARQAASRAEQSAKDARAAADRADTAATEAEKAAKDALKFAEEAQAAADRAEAQQKNTSIADGGTTGVGGVFYVVDKMVPVGEPEIKKKENCNVIIHVGDCVMTAVITFDAYIDLYLCTAENMPATQAGCPPDATVFLNSDVLKNQKTEVTHTLSMAEFNSGIDPVKILLGDFIECAQKIAPGGESGSWGGCAWAATWFIPGKAYKAIADALHAFNASLHTGVGIREAFSALRALDLDPATIARLEDTVNVYEDVFVACQRNSFPGGTRVLMADGSHRAIRDVRVGDRVLATDPRTGGLRAQGVTDTFRHDTERLVDVSVDGGVLTSTIGHRFLVLGRGWTTVAELRVGDRLRTPQGTEQTVTALRDRSGLAPRTVFDLTVDGPHTFYVRPQGERVQDVLVHNCTNIIADEGLFGAHTLGTHVRQSDDLMRAKAEVDGIAGKWTDEATAAAAVKQAIEEWVKHGSNATTLQNWMRKQSQNKGGFDAKRDCLSFDWVLKDKGSLGTVWRKGGDRAGEAAGNSIKVVLRYVPKNATPRPHNPSKYVVFTSYPLPAKK